MAKMYKATLQAINETGRLFIPEELVAKGVDEGQAIAAVLEKGKNTINNFEKVGLAEGNTLSTFPYRTKGPVGMQDYKHRNRVIQKGVHYDVTVENVN